MLTSSCLNRLQKAWCAQPRTFLDSSFYTSPEVFPIEIQQIFRHTWLYVGHAGKIPQERSVWTVEVARCSILIVRTKEGVLKAFHNTCSHRAAPVAKINPQVKRKNCLVCPYHGWTFTLDGQLRAAPDSDNFATAFDQKDYALRPARIEQWGPLIFVCLDEDAPSLETYLGKAMTLLKGYPMERMNLLSEKDYSVLCNWKTFHDNSLCDYHVNVAHSKTLKDVQGSVDDYHYDFDEYLTLLATPTTQIWRSENQICTALSQDLQSTFLTFGIFPNLHILVLPDSTFLIERIDPISNSTCKVHTEVFALPESNLMAEDIQDWYEEVFHEDRLLVEGVQQGYESGIYNSGPINRLEARMIHQQRLIRRFVVKGLKSF
jgi:phenylpropionate dioxygenase-like ring-hydroxylating dioxygenase large terminal subunit